MPSRYGASRKQRGFTLIELMIVLAILAILLAVALPAWQNQVKRAKRTAAQAEMMDIANRQQQYLLSNRSYMDTTVLAGTGFTLDADVSQNYSYTVVPNNAVAPPTFVITFTALGGQATDGNLTLNEQGVGTPAEKWDR